MLMSRTVVFHRFAVDTVVESDGTLMPAFGADWRWEPARDEADLPDRLAALADASDHAVVAAASRFGPLRIGASVLALRDLWLSKNVARDSVAMLSELEAARDWYATVTLGVEPRHARAYIALGAALSKVPVEVDAALGRLLNGSDSATQAEPDAAALLVKLVLDFGAAYLVRPIARDPAVVRGIDSADRILRGLAGIEPIPALTRVGGAGRVLSELLTSLPEFLQWAGAIASEPATERALPELLPKGTTETLADWRSAGAQIAMICAAVALVSAVRVRPLTANETRHLRNSAEVATGWTPEASLRAAEIADRLEPLLRVRLEHDLDSAGVWPVRQGVTTGAYWRALARLWERLADERVPRLCATEACNRPIGSRPNRLYCDIHRRERHREIVRRARVPRTLVGSAR
jgi:hypothetical protein